MQGLFQENFLKAVSALANSAQFIMFWSGSAQVGQVFRSEQSDLLDLTAQIQNYEIDKTLRIHKIQYDPDPVGSSGAYRVIYLKERAT